MSYAIIRNEKLTRAKAIGAYTHNERKTKNHSNKNIDTSKTDLNYYIKKNELSYIKEFDKIKEEYDLKGQIKVTSNIMCEMIFTSDQNFFNEIGYEETKRYFIESYNFICNYKNLVKQNIISAVIHIDEDTPHMHLLYIPVVHTKDKQGNNIDKISCRDFWKGKNSYRDLQDKFYKYISSKGFKLERGQASEVTQREHLTVEEYKEITNFENTKKVLENIKIELPQVPDIKEINKVMFNRDEKIVNEIIKPKDELIQNLYKDNISLHKELSKQTNLIDKAKIYEEENKVIVQENKKLNLDFKELERLHEIDTRKLKRRINILENEINVLETTLNKIKTTIKTFISWVCRKFSGSSENQILRDFQNETGTNTNLIKLINLKPNLKVKTNKENNLER